MKHAGDAALDQLEGLLEQVRLRTQLTERKRGVFYRNSRAFLHFHEDPAGMFADARVQGDDWERLPASSPAGWQALIARLDAALGAVFGD